ncbi:MAG: fumarylacetoacetate hydrolase family protein [Actinomycetota bacterium]|nr:fumarylacetoacetate hydrolase family protein [Actinomycetota bacterium]
MAYRLSTLADGRTVLLDDGLLEGESARWWDLDRLSGGRLVDPLDALADAAALDALTDGVGVPHGEPDGEVSLAGLGPSVPQPRQVFGIGMNFVAHIQEMGRNAPAIPVIFTKWPSCLAGPGADVVVVGDRTDYEVELVAVIGRTCRNLDPSEAWGVLAGVAVGQDFSDRALQLASEPPQFSLGKSHPGFGPLGPVTSVDLVDDPTDLKLHCSIDGDMRQDSHTGLMILGVPDLISYLSTVVTLLPGDLVFTGTPAGVGDPQGRCLEVGQLVESEIPGVGRLANLCV